MNRWEKGSYTYFQDDPEMPPAMLHKDYLGHTEEYHLESYAKLSIEYEATYREWTPWFKEAELEWKMEQHRTALLYEHDYSHEHFKEKIIEYQEKLKQRDEIDKGDEDIDI